MRINTKPQKVIFVELKKREEKKKEKKEPLRIIMTIHFISCAFVFCIRVDKTAVFSALFLKPSHITEMQRSISTFRWRHNLIRLCQNSTFDSKIYFFTLEKI